MALRGKEIRIAVMGATGSGKSSFINLASGSNLPVGRGLESCTSEVRTSKPFLLNGRIVTLIDTPGFDDTSRSDTDILSSIAAYLSNTYEQGAKLAGIIYMHRISDVRMGGTSKRNFRIFRELCGDSTLRNVLIVTNMWSNVDPKIGEAREQELANNDKFFKPVLEKGARLLRHGGTQASAQSILRHLINSQAATLLIQHELVNERKDLAHTAAGAELTRALKEQADRHDDELKKLRQEMEAAMRAKDEETSIWRQTSSRRNRDLNLGSHKWKPENRHYVQELEGLQEQVLQARKEVETSQVEHARRESELLKAKKEAEERKARLLEEERKARELAEARHQEHLLSLQQELQRAEAEQKRAEAEQAEKVRVEHERALALEAELQRQAQAKEEEEKTRLLAEESERARLQDEIAKARQEMERVAAEQKRREREQNQALQHEKERYQRQILEETERVRRTLEETHAKKEQEAQALRKAEEARIRQLEEQQRLKLREEEQRRLSLQEELARERKEKNTAGKADQARRDSEAEAAKQAREAALARLEEERQQAKLREEAFKKQVEEEVTRVRNAMGEELAEKERRSAEAKRAAELSRALASEAQEKARLAEEHERKKKLEGELAVLHRRVAEAEDYRRRLEAEAAERGVMERQKNAQLQEELAKARREAELARAAAQERTLKKDPPSGFVLPIPFVVWKAAMHWLGAR
ncbi:hypothetical protein J3R83DRAFT_12352 [Lanmaoa asiatica]|nr:hypothetical protein J3R83DRAFT_12352 [Lanmaoa asiatica]